MPPSPHSSLYHLYSKENKNKKIPLVAIVAAIQHTTNRRRTIHYPVVNQRRHHHHPTMPGFSSSPPRCPRRLFLVFFFSLPNAALNSYRHRRQKTIHMWKHRNDKLPSRSSTRTPRQKSASNLKNNKKERRRWRRIACGFGFRSLTRPVWRAAATAAAAANFLSIGRRRVYQSLQPGGFTKFRIPSLTWCALFALWDLFCTQIETKER